MSDLNHYPIEIILDSEYLEDLSLPKQNRYHFVYIFKIKNHGSAQFKSMRLNWAVSDGDRHIYTERSIDIDSQDLLISPGGDFSYDQQIEVSAPVAVITADGIAYTTDDEAVDVPITESVMAWRDVFH